MKGFLDRRRPGPFYHLASVIIKSAKIGVPNRPACGRHIRHESQYSIGKKNFCAPRLNRAVHFFLSPHDIHPFRDAAIAMPGDPTLMMLAVQVRDSQDELNVQRIYLVLKIHVNLWVRVKKNLYHIIVKNVSMVFVILGGYLVILAVKEDIDPVGRIKYFKLAFIGLTTFVELCKYFP